MKKQLLLILCVLIMFSLFAFGSTVSAATVLYGDANGDGVVNVGDAVMVSKYVSNTANLTDEQLTAADVNDDGSVNVGDAVLIARYSAGLLEKFPADKINGPIVFPPIEF